MEIMTSNFVDENSFKCNSEEEEEEEEEVESRDDEEDVPLREASCVQKKPPPVVPSFFYRTDKELHHYLGEDIFIEEALESFATSTWPATTALCRYLESHYKELNLVDKAVLEIGAGTGVVSIVAALLGAWVTATDFPDVLSNLRLNLSKNTRGRSRHTPQAAALSWSSDFEDTYPKSVYHYDYVVASDVVYHYDFLSKLQDTMKHFCQQGTTILWANKVRTVVDMEFEEIFKTTFNTDLVFEDGDVKIFMGTHKEEEEEQNSDVLEELQEGADSKEDTTSQSSLTEEEDNGSSKEMIGVDDEKDGEEDEDEEEESEEESDDVDEDAAVSPDADSKDSSTEGQQVKAFFWSASVSSSFGKDRYHYVGQDIDIYECVDFNEAADAYGAVMWPAALALCSFLERNTDLVNLEDKTVLELGSGTGLVAIVASLLGAKVTATDLPDYLGNLKANVMRNTRGRSRHLPQICPLSWSFDVGRVYPSRLHRYDFVLAADVVYHHKFLAELLATMSHFCHPRTTIIWANKVRMVTDIEFTDKFKKEFDATLLAEDGVMKIFMGKFKM